MKRETRAGLGIILIGLAVVLPQLQFLGMDFSVVNPYLLLIPQIGIIIAGLGMVINE